MKRLLARSSFALLAALPFMSFAGEAEAKQCVYNEAGYVAEVRWFEPNDLVIDPGSLVLNIRPGRDAVQEDTITLGFSSCNDSVTPRTAVVRIVGGEYVIKGIVWGATTIIGVVGAVAGAVGCVGSAGTACPVIAAAAPAFAGAAVSIAGEIAGDGNIQEIFYIGTPSQYNDLKIWGTVFSPQYGDGAAIAPLDLPGMQAALAPNYSTPVIGRVNATPIATYENVTAGYCMFMCTSNLTCKAVEWVPMKCELHSQGSAGGNLVTDLTNPVLGFMPWLHYEKP